MFTSRNVVAASAGLALITLSVPGAVAGSVADFYQGRTLTFIVAASAGGGYNLNSRMLMRHLPGHIPGKPKVIVQNMPGAGGVKAANHMYNVAAKDGTVLGMPISSIVIGEALRPKRVKFRSLGFGWVGTITTMTDVVAVWHTTGVKTIADARKKQVIFAATGKLSTSYLQPSLVNALLGTKFKIVEGYKSGNEMTLAIERGEAEGRTNQWTSWKTQRPQWIKQGKLNILLQIGPNHPELSHIPAFLDLVKTERDRNMVEFLQMNQMVGRSVYTPPGIPAARLAALRTAFDETMKDPAFLADMKAKGLVVNAGTGARLKAFLERVKKGEKKAVADMRALLKL